MNWKNIFRFLMVTGGIAAILNIIIGFGTVDFQIKDAYQNPEIVLTVLNQAFWTGIGMFLFFLTDSVGWYILMPIGVIVVTLSSKSKYKLPIVILAIIYAVIGNIGVFQFAYAYYAWIDGFLKDHEFLTAMFKIYDGTWGTINNAVGAVLFLFFSGALSGFKKWLSIGVGITMAAVSGGYMLSSFGLEGLKVFAATTASPFYLVGFSLLEGLLRIDD